MSQLHVIIGADDYLVDKTAKKIVGDGVGLEVIDSLNATNADLQLADIRTVDASFSTPPFLDPKKVTWWKNVHFLPGGKSSEEVKLALERFAKKIAAAKLPDNQHLILSGPHLLRTSVFAKTLAAVAEVAVFETGSPKDEARAAIGRAIGFAADAGLVFAPGVVERFVDQVGPDSRSLLNEVAKMRDYLGPGNKTISSADVEAVSSPGVKSDPVPWSVTDAIGRRDAAAALEALRPFELQSGFAVFLSGVIEKFFRQLTDVKAGRTKGMTPFVLNKNKGFAANWELSELRQARLRFLNLRERVVSGMTVGDTLVVTELLRVMRRAVRR